MLVARKLAVIEYASALERLRSASSPGTVVGASEFGPGDAEAVENSRYDSNRRVPPGTFDIAYIVLCDPSLEPQSLLRKLGPLTKLAEDLSKGLRVDAFGLLGCVADRGGFAGSRHPL